MDLQTQKELSLPDFYKRTVESLKDFRGQTPKFYNLYMELDNQSLVKKTVSMRNILASSIVEAIMIFKVELTKSEPDVSYVESNSVCGVIFK